MGTRGYIVVKYKGKYYYVYNHFDSYPSNLGKKIVNMIKQREVVKSKSYVYYILQDYKIGDLKITKNEKDVQPGGGIEWVYIVNLDEMIFEILGGYYKPKYDFNKIDEDWFEKFDEVNDRLAPPST